MVLFDHFFLIIIYLFLCLPCFVFDTKCWWQLHVWNYIHFLNPEQFSVVRLGFVVLFLEYLLYYNIIIHHIHSSSIILVTFYMFRKIVGCRFILIIVVTILKTICVTLAHKMFLILIFVHIYSFLIDIPSRAHYYYYYLF